MRDFFTSRRQGIIVALVDVLKGIDGTGEFQSNVYNNVSPRLEFWDSIDEFPALHVNAGGETRAYQGGGYKDRFLNVNIRCYVNEEDSVDALAALIEDVETLIEQNSRLQYLDRLGVTQCTHQMSVLQIDTDEGVLDPIGVGEILIEVHY